MAIALPFEIETLVFGDGDGNVVIKQTSQGEESLIFLTVHQFETIFNHEKHIVREALGTE